MPIEVLKQFRANQLRNALLEKHIRNLEKAGITLTELEAYARERQTTQDRLMGHRKTRASKLRARHANQSRWQKSKAFLDKPTQSELVAAKVKEMNLSADDFELSTTIQLHPVREAMPDDL
jgi:hypothetical protein